MFRYAVEVVPAGRVFDFDLVPFVQFVEAEEDVVGSRVRVPYTMPGDEDVGSFLPGVARGRDVDSALLQLLLRDGVEDRCVGELYLRYGYAKCFVLGTARDAPEVERLDGRYSDLR